MRWRAVSIDGGGVRGVLPAELLRLALERDLVPRDVDLVAGTSTGSLIAAAFASGIPMERVVDLYCNRAPQIFDPARGLKRLLRLGPSNPRYRSAGLRAALLEVFGEVSFGSLGRPTLVYAYDLTSGSVVPFKSWSQAHRSLPLVDVLLASCAAPTYFPGVEIGGAQLVDGGCAANNPAAGALGELLGMGARPEGIQLLSLGTGAARHAFPSCASREWGLIEWAPHIVGLLFDAQTSVVDFLCRRVLGANYLRIQPEIPGRLVPMDATDTVCDLVSAARSTWNTTRPAIRDLFQRTERLPDA
jgi:hypothetical protein